MSSPAATIEVEDLARMVGSGEIDTVVVGFTDLYGRLLGKRFDASFFVDHVTAHGTHVCDYLLTADMEMTPVAGYSFANWEKGYGDVLLAPDPGTLRVANWLDRSALVLCDVVDEDTGDLVPAAPRTILRRQRAKLQEAGFHAQAASELEYYLFRRSYEEMAGTHFDARAAAGWYIEDYHLLQGSRLEDFNAAARRHLPQSGVPIESTKGEWGLGQHEINVQHADVLEMCDRHVVLKQCLKEIAERLGISVTFMAKFAAARAGSSCHMHLSLVRNGGSAFAGEEPLGSVRGSSVFRHFLGGWMAHLPELMVFYAPTVNSYKRFQAGSWAPTRLAWSYDNRTAGFRVVGRDQSLRIECRVAGADCNPYLAYAAALASGLDGIIHRIEPPGAYDGDVYHAQDVPHVPKSLSEATRLFENSSFVRAMLGDEVVEHYVHFFRTERDAFNQTVTDWERIRYFERI
jgi:glutamine synthetase